MTPAKFSRALILRIYEHAFAEGWLAPGMTILDPFGGVALGALDAMWNGLTWVGMELEPKFVKLGEQNLALWKRKYGSKEGWGSARIVQGDSRQLAGVIAGADCCIGSPPFMECGTGADKEVHNRQVITSGTPTHKKNAVLGSTDYGSSPGQLGAMKKGDFDCVVGSPPWARQMNEGGAIGDKKGNVVRDVAIRTGRNPDAPNRQQFYQSYGSAAGQLASLPEGRFEAVISSPPYEGSLDANGDGIDWTKAQRGGHSKESGTPRSLSRGAIADGYGDGADNIGNQSGDTFWSAAAVILAQCHAILKPGGHAIWVCKDFVRKGKRVPFSDQWQVLCESVGFRLVCRHRAMLITNHGEQETIFGETERLTTERKSFFRRLAEKKGSPRIDHEDILCLERVKDAPLLAESRDFNQARELTHKNY